MSLSILALGVLTADPQERKASTGKTFVSANLRTATDDETILVSVVAFEDKAKAALLELKKGDSAAVNGRAKVTAWTGKDGKECHGLSVVAESVLTTYFLTKRRKSMDVADRGPDGYRRNAVSGSGGFVC